MYRGNSSNLPIVDAISRAKYDKIYSELDKKQKANVLRAAKQDAEYVKIEGRGRKSFKTAFANAKATVDSNST